MPSPAHPLTARLGPVWRDANIRSGPSLTSPVIRLDQPGHVPHYTADAFAHGDEVTEDQHPGGLITSAVWFRLTTGGWSSAVNFDPATITALLDGAATVTPHPPHTTP
ncbi:hypothetical protein ACFVIM_19865 [Streptomyces sp. NPDC057638]|uniref:hypothetical protein n=1 Tax=Streptomyces sp. NPDC057638 TaxID=3346190 RepID=UPI00367B8A1E